MPFLRWPPSATLIACLLPLTIATTSCASSDPATPTPPALIQVSAEGSAKATPDQASLRLSFVYEAPSVDEARRQVDKRVKSLLERLEKFTLAPKSLDTSATQIQPQYDYHKGQQTFRAHQVTRNVSFVLADLTQLEALVTALAKEDITRLHQIQFGLRDPAAAQQLAMDQAIAQSKHLATHIAHQYGVDLGRVHHVRYQGNRNHAPAPMQLMRAELAADSAPSYQQKELEFNAHIEVSFTLN